MKHKIRYDLSMMHKEVTLYRVQALEDKEYVRKGEIGGWVQNCDNLSQTGEAWVKNEGKIFNNAKVQENVLIKGDAQVYDNAHVMGKVWVKDNVEIYGESTISADGFIEGNVKIYEKPSILGKVFIYGDLAIHGNAIIRGTVNLFGDQDTTEHVTISPIHLTGLKYPVFISDRYMKVGCQKRSFASWRLRVSPSANPYTNITEENFRSTYKNVLSALVDQHEKNVKLQKEKQNG